MITPILPLLMAFSIVAMGFISNAYSDTIAIKAKLKKGTFESSLYFPDTNTTITFSSNNKICPDNKCRYEFINGTFHPSVLGDNEKYLSGTLKIEDKVSSTPDFVSYKYYKLAGTMTPAGSKGNPDQMIINYRGDLGLDTEDPIFYPESKYNSTITYDENSNMFSLEGISK
jgi:hypothetical protein